MSAVLRTTFVVNGLLFLIPGLLIYFLPLSNLGVSPLWLARVAGGLLVAWGVALFAGAARPGAASTQSVVQLAAGNLLVLATLVPAALRAGLSGPLKTLFLVLSVVLLALAMLALLLPNGNKGRL